MKKLFAIVCIGMILTYSAYGQHSVGPENDTQAIRAELTRLVSSVEALRAEVSELKRENIRMQGQFSDLVTGKLVAQAIRTDKIDMGSGTIVSEPGAIVMRAGGGIVNVNLMPYIATSPFRYLILQSDGNLVLYSQVSGGRSTWDSKTSGR